jgi:hypothetical protein
VPPLSERIGSACRIPFLMCWGPTVSGERSSSTQGVIEGAPSVVLPSAAEALYERAHPVDVPLHRSILLNAWA